MFYTQVRIQPQSMKTRIANALVATISELNFLRSVEFDKVRLYSSDFNEMELPAVQMIDVEETVVHERLRARRTWLISLECIAKSTENGYISQRDMWDYEYQISRKIWAEPQLGVKGVIQASYLSNSTDLHLIEPFYLLKMDFQVEYYENLVGEC